MQPFQMSQEQWQQLVTAYQTARDRQAQAERAYYAAAGRARPQIEPWTGMVMAQTPAGSGIQAQAAQRQLADAQQEVRRLERVYPWLKDPRGTNLQALQQQYMPAYYEEQAGRTGQPVKLAQYEKDVAALQTWQPRQAAQATTATAQLPTETAQPQYPWEVEGATPEEQLYGRAQFFGTPSPAEREQMDMQTRMWEAEMEQSASAEKRSQQQAQWAQQMDVYDSIRRNWEAKQQQAQFAQQQWQQVLPYALPQGVEYTPGFEPGGMMARSMANLGLEYDPSGFRGVPWQAPQTVGSAGAPPAMDTGTLQMILLQRAQLLGQGG